MGTKITFRTLFLQTFINIHCFPHLDMSWNMKTLWDNECEIYAYIFPYNAVILYVVFGYIFSIVFCPLQSTNSIENSHTQIKCIFSLFASLLSTQSHFTHKFSARNVVQFQVYCHFIAFSRQNKQFFTMGHRWQNYSNLATKKLRSSIPIHTCIE